MSKRTSAPRSIRKSSSSASRDKGSLVRSIASLRPLSWCVAFLVAYSIAVAQDAERTNSADTRARVRRLLDEAGAGSSANSDGTIRVEGGNSLSYPDRSILLEFLGDVRRNTIESLGGSEMFGGGGVPFFILRAVEPEGGGNSGSKAEIKYPFFRFLPSRMTPQARRLSVTLDVANPTNGLDARALAAHVVDCFLGAAVAGHAGVAETSSRVAAAELAWNRPPQWFSSGLARSFETEVRQSDFDRIRSEWARAAYPPLVHLAARDSSFAEADEALAAELVSWWISFPDLKARWKKLCERLAAGQPWTPELFIETALGDRSGDIAADRAWDLWFVSRRRAVLSPGATTRAKIVRTLAMMHLVPGRDGVPADFATSPQPLVRILDDEARPWAAAVARKKLDALVRESVGRGDDFRTASATLAEILARIADNRSPGRNAAQRIIDALDAMAESATVVYPFS